MYKRRGYVLVWDPTNPMRGSDGMVYLHRKVMSEKLGRPLMSDEIVHHIDFNKENNHPDNLLLTTVVEHNKIHKLKRESKPCVVCGKLTLNPRTCSTRCGSVVGNESKIPNAEKLQKLLKEFSTREIAKKYRVSTSVVRKWRKKHDV